MKQSLRAGEAALGVIGDEVRDWRKVMPQYVSANSRLFRSSPVAELAVNQEIKVAVRTGSSDPETIMKRMGPELQALLLEDILVGRVYERLEAKRRGGLVKTTARHASLRVSDEGVKVVRLLLGDSYENDEGVVRIPSYRDIEDASVGTVYSGRLRDIYTAPDVGGIAVLRRFPHGSIVVMGLVDVVEGTPQVDLTLQ